MTSRGAITKETRKTLGDKDLQSMFERMAGIKSGDPLVIAPKYGLILECIEAIIKRFKSLFLKSVGVSKNITVNFNKTLSEIQTFCNNGKAEIAMLKIKQKKLLAGKDLAALNDDIDLLDKFVQNLSTGCDEKELCDKYKKLKQCHTVDCIITAVRDLREVVEYDQKHHGKKHHDLHQKDELSDSFIRNCKSDYLQLIPSITLLDFKQLWLQTQCSRLMKRSIIYCLHLFFNNAMKIVDAIMTPDIDVEKFFYCLVDSLDKIRKMIPRCDKAFDKIGQSMELLKKNFGGYYRSFVVSENPAVMIESFVTDVANESANDATLTSQFRQILKFYTEKTKGVPVSPEVSKMLKLMNDNMNILEKKTGIKHKR